MGGSCWCWGKRAWENASAREVAVDVLRQQGLIIVGRCYESEQILPLGPWVDAFRKEPSSSKIRTCSRILVELRAELGRLFPS